MTTFSDVFSAGIEHVRKQWGWFLSLGILVMLLGVVCIAKAKTTTTVAVLIFGWMLLLSGVVWFVSAFQAWGWGGFFLYILNAFIRGVTGYLLVRHPNAGAAAVTMLLAILFLVGGSFRIVAAAVIHFPRWGWTAFAGAVSIVLGILLLRDWTAASTFFVGLAIGIDLIFDGASLVGFAGAIHSLYAPQTRAV
jgi:uncharacterized membrane protein HdeD (DUF308 family)